MVLKIHNKKVSEKGLTYVEITVVIAIIAIISAYALLSVNPSELRGKARDEKRVSDLQLIDRAINEYRIDNGVYPDFSDIVRVSTSLPVGSSGPLVNSLGNGWIAADLSDYITKLPTDPLNDSTHHYSYAHTDFGYELQASLEVLTEYSLNSNDGGDDDLYYELGNDLTIL
ncbi:MAG: hypothetical protein ACOZAO_05445 [Patescibacteria group bacterium]